VKGHLPLEELDRARSAFAAASTEACRVLVLHHNVLRGEISNRWGLARPHEAQRGLAAAGAELVLCGHDHQEAVGALEGGTVVATASTHTFMTRGRRPSVFNLIDLDRTSILVRPMRWNGGGFSPGEASRFPRHIRQAQSAEMGSDPNSRVGV
jgi:3',5'-cyclic AMP phosphodiesterase CpdA